MNKAALEQQLQQQLKDKRLFRHMLFSEDVSHVLAQIIFWLGLVLLVFTALGWLLLGFNVLLTGSTAMKLMILKQAGRVFWLLPLHPLMSAGWGGYLILAADIALVYCLIWRCGQLMHRKQLYQSFSQQQLRLVLASAEQLNNKYNLIYQSEQSATSLTQALKSLPKKQRDQWALLTHRPTFFSREHNAIDQKKIKQFLETNFNGTYQYVDTLLTAPAALPIYWSLSTAQTVVAMLTDSRGHCHYLLHYFDQKNQRIKVSWRQRAANLLQIILFH